MVVTWLVAVGVAVLACACAAWLRRGGCVGGGGGDVKGFSSIPGPRGLPLIGNALEFLLGQVALFYQTRFLANKYPDIFKLRVSNFKIIGLQNPADIEVVLSSSAHNEKSFLYSFLKPWLKQGLLLSDGTKWYTRRKILTSAFHFNILKHFSGILEENSGRLVQDLLPEVDKARTDLMPIMSAYTLHSICDTAMGTTLQEHTSDILKRYKKSIHELGKTFVKRLTCFWLHPTWLFNCSSLGARQRKLLGEVRTFPSRVIEERRQYRKDYPQDDCTQDFDEHSDLRMDTSNGGKKRMAMLDLLLTVEKEGLIDGNGIQEEVDTFMFEAHDTTSCGLVYTLLLLANHQDVQEKVIAELDAMFMGTQRAASMAELAEMKYLEACVKESLRLYPPVPFIARRIGEELKLKEYVVPAGTQCHINIFDLHRRADLFHKPLQFLPERFMSDRRDSQHPYAYIPFSAGPRNCIGQKFAMLELKSAVSSLLRNYRLQPVTKPADLVFIADLVLRCNHPVYVKFIKRK